jgi:thioredoxin reductase (NADPH)
MISSGARYKALAVERWTDFEGAGIYHAATELEANSCDGEVVVVGGANSAGQASLFLASRQKNVNLVVRSGDIGQGMSRYLTDRILADDHIRVHVDTEVEVLHGEDRLEFVTVRNGISGVRDKLPCSGLFCFIGAVPSTDWVDGISLDEDGFVLTDRDLPSRPSDPYLMLGRQPLPFETSVPGVFAVGDVRHG